jgi:hypothetical protein
MCGTLAISTASIQGTLTGKTLSRYYCIYWRILLQRNNTCIYNMTPNFIPVSDTVSLEYCIHSRTFFETNCLCWSILLQSNVTFSKKYRTVPQKCKFRSLSVIGLSGKVCGKNKDFWGMPQCMGTQWLKNNLQSSLARFKIRASRLRKNFLNPNPTSLNSRFKTEAPLDSRSCFFLDLESWVRGSLGRVGWQQSAKKCIFWHSKNALSFEVKHIQKNTANTS